MLRRPKINDALRLFNVDAIGGRTQIGGVQQSVRVLGSVPSVEALRELTIPSERGFVKLADVASIGDGSGEVRGFARLNARPVVGFLVYKTKQSYRETVNVLLEGMLLAVLVVWLFLRDWRTTVIAAIAMPVSMIPTFWVMHMLGFSLNMVSLLRLTLVVGILVDDAIVEIENIQKRVTSGTTPYRAAYFGADAIGLAVVATTLCIVVVFAPVSYMPGIGGQYFSEFGITVAVVFSLAVARLLTPLLAAFFLAPEPRAPLPKLYQQALKWALDHRKSSVALGGFMFDVTTRLLEHPDIELVFANMGSRGAGNGDRGGRGAIELDGAIARARAGGLRVRRRFRDVAAPEAHALRHAARDGGSQS